MYPAAGCYVRCTYGGGKKVNTRDDRQAAEAACMRRPTLVDVFNLFSMDMSFVERVEYIILKAKLKSREKSMESYIYSSISL